MQTQGDKPSLSAVAAELARRWATQRLSAVQTYGRILEDYGAGRSSSGEAMAAWVKLAAGEAVNYSSDALGLAGDYATAVAQRAGLPIGSVSTAGPARAPIHDLELSGPLGGRAAGEFVLTNPHDRTAHLSFTTSTFSGPAGETPVAVIMDPAEFSLAAGQEQRVAVSVAIDKKKMRAGERYNANVAIAGFDDMVLRVRLSVLDAG